MPPMFSREATRLSAWAALIAVLFAVLMPAAINAAGLSRPSTDPAGLSVVCTLGGAKVMLPDAGDGSDNRISAHQQPCAFCTSAVPLFADAHAPRVVAVIDGMPVVVPQYSAEQIPPNPAATQPLSPRAPPRI